jgi:aldehyde dehydrogenase (NAD+)
VSGKLEAGSVAINSFFLPAIDTPFGGAKESGIGREGGRNGILPYLETKTIHIK